jgi:hypothetical protein
MQAAIERDIEIFRELLMELDARGGDAFLEALFLEQLEIRRGRVVRIALRRGGLPDRFGCHLRDSLPANLQLETSRADRPLILLHVGLDHSCQLVPQCFDAGMLN